MKPINVIKTLPPVSLTLEVSGEINNRINEIAAQKDIDKEKVILKALSLYSAACRAEQEGDTIGVLTETDSGYLTLKSTIKGI